MHRRQLLSRAALLPLLPLAACQGRPELPPGDWAGQDWQQGHALRQRLAQGLPITPDVQRRTQVLIAGAGIAGLAAARALRLAGVADVRLLELQTQAGGNSRASQLGGLPCPLGAHYLPLPGEAATEVQDLLEEFGLRQRVAGRWRYDERHLCHSPQERLYLHGQWQEGLLPMADVGAATLAQYRRFAQQVQALSQAAPFAMPALTQWARRSKTQKNSGIASVHLELDAITFDEWLGRQGLDDGYLRWYLDYCCRDDYGAGLARVSAWAGIHYFASRHGFALPGDDQAPAQEREGLLTWPEGNAWLAQRLAAPLQAGGQLLTGRGVLQIAEGRHGVQLDALDMASGRIERWQAQRCIVALPLFMAARVLAAGAPDFVAQAAQRLPSAPWLVTNLHLQRPLADSPGAAPAWDNVLHDDPALGALGYVDAGHQRLAGGALLAGPKVLTYYQALGDLPGAREQLQQLPWTHWASAIIASLARAHPDLPQQVTQVELMRYGHAMAMPQPGLQAFLSQIGQLPTSGHGKALSNGERPRPLPTPRSARLLFAHSDWSGYSVFEEAFTRGHAAGLAALG
ncbi:FAD-dependent oxidoreductase [Melaminivora sp.]